MAVGVLAVQGDFARHLALLAGIGAEAREVRTVENLATVERLIIPGGESTTVGLLLARYGLGDAIRARAAEGMPLWGTCMGMILLAQSIEGRPEQPTLGLLDIEVRRNAFGAQVHSFETNVPVKGMGEVEAVFIRAPIVTRTGPGVESVAEYDGKTVAVRQERRLGTSFHPELTGDDRLHRAFLDL